jgi:hypothetical protein
VHLVVVLESRDESAWFRCRLAARLGACTGLRLNKSIEAQRDALSRIKLPFPKYNSDIKQSSIYDKDGGVVNDEERHSISPIWGKLWSLLAALQLPQCIAARTIKSISSSCLLWALPQVG